MHMAVSLSYNNLSSPQLLSSKSLNTSAFYKPQSLSFHSQLHKLGLVSKHIIGFSQLKPSLSLKRSFKSCLANQEHSSPTEEAVVNKKHASGLNNLIRVYREAIIYGDAKSIAEIEARILIIESENGELVEKVSSLSAELASGKEKYIRLQADFDNFRKRSDKERINVRSDAVGEVIESLLPMVDSFERAKQQIKPETEKEKKIDISYQGIYKQFVEIMRSLKVAVVPTVGKPFNPAVHEAIAREESLEYKEGIVIQEFRRGFLLGDRLLRPATVKVSAGPGNKRATLGTELSGKSATAAGVD